MRPKSPLTTSCLILLATGLLAAGGGAASDGARGDRCSSLRALDARIASGARGAVATGGSNGQGCPSGLVTVNAFPIPGPIAGVTDGIYAIWWDGDFSHAADTSTVFDRLDTVRNDSLGSLGMQDPPNLDQCVFYNIYIHHGTDDDFPNWWANGQGTDENLRPYLTLPDGAHLQDSNLYHEGFHIFQYNAESPGFDLPDTYWYIEASAQWYMATKMRDEDVAFIEAGAIVANPQLAMWHDFDNGAPGDSSDWLFAVRQYGMHTWLFYLTEIRGVRSGLITEGFYNGTELSPQEYLYSQIGGETIRRLFADWAAANTAGLTYLTPGQIERARAEADAVGNPADFNPYVTEVTASTLESGWTWQPCAASSCHRPRGWAYNVVRIAHGTAAGEYHVELSGQPTGSDGAASHFEGRLVVMEPGGPRVEPMHMANARAGKGSVFVAADVDEVFVVVVSVPDHFSGNQTYGYGLTGRFEAGADSRTLFRDGFDSGTTRFWGGADP